MSDAVMITGSGGLVIDFKATNSPVSTFWASLTLPEKEGRKRQDEPD
jgi:hypothetical protein